MSINNPEAGSSFDRFPLHSSLARGISEAGFSEPRAIQLQTIPAALEGRDVLGLAQTGTGKTAAFALPMLQSLLGERRSGPRALVLAPTRELAAQISAEIALLARFTRLSVTTIFGGTSAHKQRQALSRNPEVLVACPGRLLDLLQQGALTLSHVETLVIDEADFMFDMGFLPDIRRILGQLPANRQNLMFSATMPKEIRRLAEQVLRNPHVADVAHRTPLGTIEHAIYPVENPQKLPLLKHILGQGELTSAIVFTRTKHRARRLAQQIGKAGHRAVALQGNMSQGQRERAMQGFRDGRFDVLIATDIAARGIDVQQVSHVVNFDMPNTTEAYTHRIGRTGRAERAGKAYTFVTGEDRQLVSQVEKRLGRPIQRLQVQGIESISFPAAQTATRKSPHKPTGPKKSRSPKQHQSQGSQGSQRGQGTEGAEAPKGRRRSRRRRFRHAS